MSIEGLALIALNLCVLLLAARTNQELARMLARITERVGT